MLVCLRPRQCSRHECEGCCLFLLKTILFLLVFDGKSGAYGDGKMLKLYYRHSGNSLPVYCLFCESHQTLEEFYLFVPLYTSVYICLPPSAARSGSALLSSVLSCASLQAGAASLFGLKELYLSHCMTMAHLAATANILSSPGVGFPQVQGWIVSAVDLGRLGQGRVWAGALSWQDSVGMSMFTEFSFPSGNLGMNSWRPVQTEACGY